MADKQSIGWIGTGKMGAPMAGNLGKAGFPLTVYNRSPAKARELAAAGAEIASDIASLAAKSDVVISMIADDAALEEIATSADGVLANAKPEAVFIDMSTVSPAASARVARAAEAQGIAYLRAPVSGSTNFAEAGTLTVIASGPKEAFDANAEIFAAMAARTFYTGPGDEARTIKLALNMMVGITAAMLGEALAFGGGGGLEWEQVFEVISGSTLASPIFDFKMEAMKKRDFSPAFTVAQMAKDFDLALDAGRANNVPLPITSMVRNYWSTMMATGKGNLDFFAYVLLMEEMAGLREPSRS